jgi:hypothetical protein
MKSAEAISEREKDCHASLAMTRKRRPAMARGEKPDESGNYENLERRGFYTKLCGGLYSKRFGFRT